MRKKEMRSFLRGAADDAFDSLRVEKSKSGAV